MFGLDIIPSKADYGKTSGAYGNSNGNPDDDLVYLRNTNIEANSLEQYLESFK